MFDLFAKKALKLTAKYQSELDENKNREEILF